MSEFEVGNQKYTSTPLNVQQQFKIVKRLGLSFGMLAARNKEAGAVTAITPFILAMGALSDSDADFIKDTCLATVKRVALNTTPAPIFTSGQLMFLDIGLSEMIQIVALVLEANVGNFIADLQDQLSEAIAKARISSGTPTA